MRPVKFFIVYVLALFALIVSCKKEINPKTSRPKPEKEIIAEWKLNPTSPAVRVKTLHLVEDTVYILNTPVTRESGEQLLIDPGTVIKVMPGAGIDIKPGALIVANGSSENPIVFTSNLPTGSRNNFWNGISITGKSFNNNYSAIGNPDDASGSIRYTRIEFGNLSLNSIGKGTFLDHIQVSYANSKPAFEFDGGNAEGKYLVSYACGSAADFYCGNGYSGKLQFILAYRHPFFGALSVRPAQSISGIFIENNNIFPKAVPETFPLISNASIVGPSGANGTAAAYLDTSGNIFNAALVTSNNAGFRMRNSVFLGFPFAGWQIGDSASAYKVHRLKSEFTSNLLYCQTSPRAFFIERGIYPPYDAGDFASFMLEPRFGNRQETSLAAIGFRNIFSYSAQGPVPVEGAQVLYGADFNDAPPFFDRVSFRGAVGIDNWLLGWTNFNPLKTDYNVAK